MDPGLVRLNGLPLPAARDALRACCAATAWLDAVVGARPYASSAALLGASATALAALDWAGVREALDAHPRIGEAREPINVVSGEACEPINVVSGERATRAAADREAAWSAQEQSGMDSASAQTRTAFVEANRAYEERFGHVFLIFATGKTDADMLAAARERAHHDEAVERETVRSELALIVNLRLHKLLDVA